MDNSTLEFLTIIGTVVTIVARLVYIKSQVRSKKRHNKK